MNPQLSTEKKELVARLRERQKKSPSEFVDCEVSRSTLPREEKELSEIIRGMAIPEYFRRLMKKVAVFKGKML